MSRRMIFPVLMGLIGVLVLCSLGIWQVQRMHWKAGVLAEINAMIGATPVALPAQPDPLTDKYRPVSLEGRFSGDTIEVLSGTKEDGPGVRVIAAFETRDGRRVMIDRGFVAEDSRGTPFAVTDAKIIGNLHWPKDGDAYTPPPDPKSGMWFARDVAAMAAVLHTEPTLIVASAPTGDAIQPMPVDTSSIPNDHWGYAITWFSLAAVWAGMTGYLLWRIRRKTV